MLRAALIAAFVGPASLLGWLRGVEGIAGRCPARVRHPVRVLGWFLPATSLAVLFLAWPLVWTVVLSLRDAEGAAWQGLANYEFLASSRDLSTALRNNVLWLAGLCTIPLLIGLLVAVLADQVRFESMAKAVIVAPVAISFVAAAVTWRSVFQYRPLSRPQTGTLNFLLVEAGFDPIAWLIDTRANNAALITIGVWMTVGFSATILSAAIKGIPPELLEAAKVDGATNWQSFRFIVVPQIRPALVVVVTAMAITALKAFDVVYVMTNGALGTNVVANVLYQQLFLAQHDGHASAVAILLCAVAAPIVIVNVRSARRVTT